MASSKRQRLSRLVAVSDCSGRKLSELVRIAREDGVEVASQKTISRALLSLFEGVRHYINLPLDAGGDFRWVVCHPGLFLAQCLATSESLRHLFAAASPSTPHLPWTLVLSHDEATPGALLRPDNKRKFSAFYFALLEIGSTALRYDRCWFPIAVLRTTIAARVAGGLSGVLRMLLRYLSDLFAVGVDVALPSGPSRLYARLGPHLADGDALRASLALKGASGLKPCMLCANVLKKHSDLAHRRPGLVEIDEVDTDKFLLHDDETLWALFDSLQALPAGMPSGARGARESLAGLNVGPDVVFADLPLRAAFKPVSHIYYDWMHTYLQGGLLNEELFNFRRM